MFHLVIYKPSNISGLHCMNVWVQDTHLCTVCVMVMYWNSIEETGQSTKCTLIKNKDCIHFAMCISLTSFTFTFNKNRNKRKEKRYMSSLILYWIGFIPSACLLFVKLGHFPNDKTKQNKTFAALKQQVFHNMWAPSVC